MAQDALMDEPDALQIGGEGKAAERALHDPLLASGAAHRSDSRHASRSSSSHASSVDSCVAHSFRNP